MVSPRRNEPQIAALRLYLVARNVPIQPELSSSFLHEQLLSDRKNVIGLGIAPANDESGGKDLAVAVYVTKKVPLAN